jgi:hypothetical protein
VLAVAVGLKYDRHNHPSVDLGSRLHDLLTALTSLLPEEMRVTGILVAGHLTVAAARRA